MSVVVAAPHPNDKTGEWVRFLTNLPRDSFSVTDVQIAYRLRWQIELLFKELKSHANLHAFVTRKKPIAEGLIWASIAAAIIKRFVAYMCQIAEETPISSRRVATCGEHVLGTVLTSVRASLASLKSILTALFRYLAHNAPRANIPREAVSGRLRLGLSPASAGS